MKNRCLLLFLLSLFLSSSLSVSGQNHDHIWYYGENDPFGGAQQAGKLDFNFNPPLPSLTERPVEVNAYAHIMSDSVGAEVLYYSNGFNIYNAKDEVMLNGNDINEAYWVGQLTPSGYPYSGLSIPYPYRDDNYLYFHHPVEQGVAATLRYNLYFSQIDMTQEGGDGAVVVKDSLLWEGRFAGFGTTKAGDGVNWWLVVADYNTPTLYTYAVDDVGISLHHVDTLVLEGYSFSSVEERDFSYVGFSPDGTQFLIYDEGEGIISLDFNRCEGSFSNAFFRAMPSMDRTNLAFSRNSRFAYINSLDQLLQVDLFSKEEGLLLDTIANWDGYYPPGSQLFFATRFGYSQLAPDGKIYISGTASGAVHIIERPNLPGQACGFRQVGFNLPVLFFNSIPHFPNYRLEPLDCD